jgi:hypothetical protein
MERGEGKTRPKWETFMDDVQKRSKWPMGGHGGWRNKVDNPPRGMRRKSERVSLVGRALEQNDGGRERREAELGGENEDWHGCWPSIM